MILRHGLELIPFSFCLVLLFPCTIVLRHLSERCCFGISVFVYRMHRPVRSRHPTVSFIRSIPGRFNNRALYKTVAASRQWNGRKSQDWPPRSPFIICVVRRAASRPGFLASPSWTLGHTRRVHPLWYWILAGIYKWRMSGGINHGSKHLVCGDNILPLCC